MTERTKVWCVFRIVRFWELAEKWHAPRTKEKEITQVRELLWSESKTLGAHTAADFHWESARGKKGLRPYAVALSLSLRSVNLHSCTHIIYWSKKERDFCFAHIHSRGVIFFCIHPLFLSGWHCFQAHGAFSAAFVCYFTGPKRGWYNRWCSRGVLIWKLHGLHRNIHGKRATHMGHSRSLVHSKYIIHFIVRQIDLLTRET